jgi:chemotaxis protein methyltransferase CheR
MSFAEDKVRWQGWKIDILGTDVSRSAVERAREGLYSQFEVQRGLSVIQMMRWFEEEGQQQWRIASQLRDGVRFQVHSLREPVPHPGQFDIILCRNVLLYFAPETRKSVFATLAAAAAPDACLMLGAAETVIGHTEEFVPDPECRGLYLRCEPPETGQVAVAGRPRL